jgi:hypothetical protein
MTLVEFLLARIAEDKAAALAATRNAWKVDPWRNSSGMEFLVVADFDEGAPAFAIKNERDADHIARWDPARVLAECEAKRRIVEELGDYDDGYVWASGEASRAETALQALALPYADHPDYDESWKP